MLTGLGEGGRDPLLDVLNVLSTLLLSELDDRQRRQVLRAIRGATRLLDLLSDVREFVELGRAPATAQPVRFRPSEVVRDLARRMRADARDGVFLSVEDPDDAVVVHGDRSCTERVLGELIAAALARTSAGAVRIRTELRDEPTAGPALRCRVQDAGPAAHHAECAEIDMPFRGPLVGTGRELRLAICRRIVEGLGGSIGCRPVDGRGLELWFVLPVASWERSGSWTSAAPPSRGPFEGEVLVVEDDPVNRFVICNYLERKGLTVDVACDGREAIDRVRTHDYQLVFMDWYLPELDGIDAVRTIRGELGRTELPIVAVTARAGEAARKAFLSAGADDYLPKPIQPDAMNAVLAQWLSKPPAAGAG